MTEELFLDAIRLTVSPLLPLERIDEDGKPNGVMIHSFRINDGEFLVSQQCYDAVKRECQKKEKGNNEDQSER